MGRLSAVAVSLLGALALLGCDENKGDLPPPPPVTGRSNAVTAKETATVKPTAAPPAATAPKPPRQVCVDQKERGAPKGALKTAAADGATAPPTPLPTGVGKWVWVNLWAAWCGPCKEEMPRLVSWQDKLRASGVLIDLAFVSMDDDARQMQRFLEAQPPGGVRATYWLPEGERAGWLGSIGLKESAQLPVQILVAPSGQVACVIEGAVEDRDYPAVAAFVSAKR